MFWNLVDVAAIVGAIALVVAFGPGVLGMAKWRARLQRRVEESQAAGPQVTRKRSPAK